MELEILDYSIYGNTCDQDSDRLLAVAAQRERLSVCVTKLTRDVPITLAAPCIWLRYDLRTWDELRWIVDLAETFQETGMRVFPKARSLQISEDKWETYQALSRAGVSTVTTFPVSQVQHCGAKAVIKPRVGWGGMKMRVVTDTRRFDLDQDEAQDHFICQPYIAHEQTWTIAAAAGIILACIEKSPGSGDFRTNELHGGTTCPALLPGGAASLTLTALEVVDLTAGTVDLIMGEHGLEVLEVNSAPGLYYPSIPDLDLAGPMVRAVLAWMGQP